MKETDEYIYKTEPSDFEMYCWFTFVMIVGFVFGFMIGGSY